MPQPHAGSYIPALDQGTTSSHALLVERGGAIVALAQREFAQLYPRPGWVEHDPRDIWSSQAGIAAEAGVGAAAIAGIGITNQRETTIVWDRATGQPVYNAIVWQDRRTAGYCGERKARGLEPMVRAKTGLPIDAYFSATKIRWILDQVEGARENARAGRRDIGELQRHWSLERRFAPSLPRGDAARRLAGWQRAIVAAKAWADAGCADAADDGQASQAAWAVRAKSKSTYDGGFPPSRLPGSRRAPAAGRALPGLSRFTHDRPSHLRL